MRHTLALVLVLAAAPIALAQDRTDFDEIRLELGAVGPGSSTISIARDGAAHVEEWGRPTYSAPDQPHAEGLVRSDGRATPAELGAVRAALRAFDPRRVTIDTEQAKSTPGGRLAFTAGGQTTSFRASQDLF